MFSLMQLKESQQREQALSADLEAAKKAQQEAQQQLQQAQSQVQAARDAPMAIPSPSHRSTENGDPLSPPPSCILQPPSLSPTPGPLPFPLRPPLCSPLSLLSTPLPCPPLPSCIFATRCYSDDRAMQCIGDAPLQEEEFHKFRPANKTDHLCIMAITKRQHRLQCACGRTMSMIHSCMA